MANRPAKNMSSLESQMIVPTLTMFGRVRECTRDVSKVLLATGAVVTRVIMASAGAWYDRGCDGRGGNVIRSSPLPAPPRGMTCSPARLRGVSTVSDPTGRASAPATVLVYSHRSEVRDAVRTAVGRRPAADVGPLTWLECETGDEVVATVDAGGVDLCILDGEAQPTGGLAVTRTLDQEVVDRPAVCVLIARQPDRWLAHWSRAEGTLPLPVDPLTAPGVVADLLRAHAQRPVVRR
jgi:CheY-like chemotaxis protein